MGRCGIHQRLDVLRATVAVDASSVVDVHGVGREQDEEKLSSEIRISTDNVSVGDLAATTRARDGCLGAGDQCGCHGSSVGHGARVCLAESMGNFPWLS